MNINLPLELHNRFKSVTAAQGKDMTTVLMEFIQSYVDRHTPSTPRPKGRRA